MQQQMHRKVERRSKLRILVRSSSVHVGRPLDLRSVDESDTLGRSPDTIGTTKRILGWPFREDDAQLEAILVWFLREDGAQAQTSTLCVGGRACMSAW